MHSFRTALRISSRHWAYILNYLGVLSVIGIVITAGFSQGTSFQETVGRVAVIDRDESAISRGLSGHLATYSVADLSDEAKLMVVEDSTEALADLVAQDRASYVVVIPKGFGDALVEAAARGSELPTLETVISYKSGSGLIMDARLSQYLQAAYGYAATIARGDQARAAELATQTMAAKVDVEVIPSELAPLPDGLIGYFGWCVYPLFTATSVLVAVLMKSLNREELDRRARCAPVTAGSRSLQVLLACVVLGIASWLWVMGLGIAVSGWRVLAANGLQLALMGAALLAYALVSASVGFLVGQLGVSKMAANAIGNVGGLLMSFLGGAWTPLEYQGEGMRAAARLAPSFWTSQAIMGARDMSSASAESVLASLGCTGLVFLFAVTFALMGFAAGSTRQHQS